MKVVQGEANLIENDRSRHFQVTCPIFWNTCTRTAMVFRENDLRDIVLRRVEPKVG